jgi:hypothetical protein
MTRNFIGPGEGYVAAVPDEELFGEIIDMVDQVDLSAFENGYRADGSGGRPFDPRLMVVAIIWYGRCGWRSPSQLARMCRTHVLLRSWFGERIPSLSTFRHFLVVHARAWRQFFPEVLRLCDEVHLADPSITATDGTALGSPGSLSGQIPLWQIRVDIGEIEDSLEAMARSRDRLADDLMVGKVDIGTFVDVVCDQDREVERRLRRQLSKLVAAERICAKRAADAVPPWAPDPAAVSERLARQELTLEEMIAKQRAKYDRYVEAVAGGARWRGSVPVPPDQYKHIHKQRERV